MNQAIGFIALATYLCLAIGLLAVATRKNIRDPLLPADDDEIKNT